MATTLITGANRGIGLEMARLAAERGDSVIAACRASSPHLDAVAQRTGLRVEAGLDVASDGSVAGLARRLAGIRLDVLVNNAGVLRRTPLSDLDWAGIRDQLEVNSLGPLRVTAALLDNLGRGSKVAIITSRMGSLADNTSGGSYGYRMSKAAVNMAGVSLARDLKARGIAVALLHPGWVRTDMTEGTGNVDPAQSAADLLARIDDLSLANTGTFWHASGEVLPW